MVPRSRSGVDRDMIARIGLAVGLALVGLSSWMTSLARSRVLEGAWPSLSETLNSMLVFGPLLLFGGFTILFMSLTKRVIISVVLSAILTVILTWLLWG